jgi:hypothetical protein
MMDLFCIAGGPVHFHAHFYIEGVLQNIPSIEVHAVLCKELLDHPKQIQSPGEMLLLLYCCCCKLTQLFNDG